MQQLENEINEYTALISIQFANNETGVIFNYNKISKIIQEKKKYFDFIYHIDAVQALGKIKIDTAILGCDMLSISGHKINALKGIGFLFVKNNIKFIPLISGHQESDKRGGTENVVGIVSLGKAAEIINLNLENKINHLKNLKKHFEYEIKKIKNIKIIAENSNRLCNTVNCIIDGYNGNEIMFLLERFGIFISTGSACNSKESEPSHVLRAMKIKNAQSAIRISFGNENTEEQINYFIEKLKIILKDKKQ